MRKQIKAYFVWWLSLTHLKRTFFFCWAIIEKSSTEGLFFNPYGDGIGGYIRVRFRESISSPKRNSKSQEKRKK